MIWYKVKVLEIFNVECGATPSTTIKEYWDDGKIKWITPKDLGKIESVFISDTERKISLTGLNSCSTSLIPKSSIILSTRAPIGYLAILLTEMCFNQGCKALVPKSKDISSKFYYYYLKTLVDYLNSIGRGSTFKEISKSQISNLQIPLPPLNEQNRIVEKIEELFTKLDSAITELKNVKKQLKRYRQSVLKSAFEGKLTEEWRKEKNLTLDSWQNKPINEYTEINPQKIKLKDETTLVTFLPMKNVEEVTGNFDLSIEKKYSEVKSGFTSFIDGDVIFAKITPCMENGKIAVVDLLKNGIGFGSTEFHVIRCGKELLNFYLFYFLVRDAYRGNAQQFMTGAVGQKRVPKTFLETTNIPKPKIDEQQKIVEEIESRFSVVNKIEEEIDKNLKKTEQLRQSILKKAFEGRLVPQDPNDEPAEKLLDRIKKEKDDKK